MSLGTCSYAQIIQRWKARINFRREYLRMYAEYIHVPRSQCPSSSSILVHPLETWVLSNYTGHVSPKTWLWCKLKQSMWRLKTTLLLYMVDFWSSSLYASKLGAETACCGSCFHILVVPGKKDYLCAFTDDCGTRNFMSWPLVVLTRVRIKNGVDGMQTRPYTIR